MYPGAHARTSPDRAAVIMAESGDTLTYAELDERSARFARVLHDAGVRRGDVIALLAENTIQYMEIYWAAMRSGLCFVPINWHLSADEAAYIVNDSGARVAVVSAMLADLAGALAARTPRVEHLFAVGGEIPGYLRYEEALAGAGERFSEEPRGRIMLYSSGTTGRPKGVKNAVPDDLHVGDPTADIVVPFANQVFGIDAEEVYLGPGPLHHTAPLRFASAVHALGGTVVLMERFDAEPALATIERYRVTAAQFVPTMFVRMLKLPEPTRRAYDLSSLRVAVHSAAPCPVDVKRAMIEWWGPILGEYYSATEVHGVTVIHTAESLVRPGSVGRAAIGVIHVCDEAGTELAPGQDGLVYFERDTLAFEYHDDPEMTKAAQHPQHPLWTSVGDIGHVDEEGYLYLTDRKAFMIISGGVNIYPQEVENVLTLHPKVFDVAVVGIPDPEMGEQVKAVVQPAEGVAASLELEAELIEFVRARVAHYKAPRSVDFVQELPRSAAGKLVKHKVREPYLAAAAASSRPLVVAIGG